MDKYKFLFYFAFIIFSSSCMSTAYFTGDATPPEKQLPEEIKSMVILNRTYIDNLLQEAIQTGCIGKCDRPGVPQCIRAMTDELEKNHYYQTILDMKGLKAYQSNTFPPALTANEISNYCKLYKVDAVVALEIFDVKTDIDYIKGVKTQMDAAGKDYQIKIVTAKQKTIVIAGWRVYNGKDNTIADQFMLEKQFLWNADGIDESNAKSKLPVLSNELPRVGDELGIAYITRISPKREAIIRNYFGKENNAFKQAKLYIKSNNWEAAKTIWLEQSKSNDNKTAGMALMNLAVYYEKQNELGKALEFAKKSNQLYKNNYSTIYIKELENIQQKR